MITYLILVLAVNCAAKSFNSFHFNSPPPYVQSKDGFDRARLYLEINLPHKIENITNSDAREPYAFATIVKVASKLAFAVRTTSPPQRYDPIKILHESEPIVREDYNIIANATKDIMSEALVTIEPITRIITKKCHSTTNIELCNEKVAIAIKSSDSGIKKRAKLLLQLGKVSEHLNSYSNLLNVVIADNKEVSYLKHHIQDPSLKKFMKNLAATYSTLNAIHL